MKLHKRIPEFKEEVKASLEQLGNSPEEIAKSLIFLGIKGKKCSEFCCPLVNYLSMDFHRKKLPFINFIITSECILLYDPNMDREEYLSFLIDVDLGHQVKSFVKRLDKEEFPDLLENNDEIGTKNKLSV